jgi:mgtE-like transporter
MAFYTMKGIVKDSLPVLMITAIMSIMGGQLLNGGVETLVRLPVILIMIPPLMKVGGDTGSILSARLSSALHMGLIDSRLSWNPVIRNNLIASMIIGFTTYLLLSIVIWIVSVSLGMSIALITLLGIGVIAGTAQMLVVLGVTMILVLLSHRVGMDPDSTVIPVITTSGDFIGICCIFLTISLLGLI